MNQDSSLLGLAKGKIETTFACRVEQSKVSVVVNLRRIPSRLLSETLMTLERGLLRLLAVSETPAERHY